MILTAPLIELAPYSVPCGPRRTSTRSMSIHVEVGLRAAVVCRRPADTGDRHVVVIDRNLGLAGPVDTTNNIFLVARTTVNQVQTCHVGGKVGKVNHTHLFEQVLVQGKYACRDGLQVLFATLGGGNDDLFYLGVDAVVVANIASRPRMSPDFLLMSLLL